MMTIVIRSTTMVMVMKKNISRGEGGADREREGER